MGGYNFCIPERDKPLLHMIALYAFAHVQGLCHPAKQKMVLREREREILTWIAAGKTLAQIGDILNISTRTVEWHLQGTAAKLGAETRTQAVVVALSEGLISV
jgi:DNA-binding CsgD family transcriptional regulator